MKKLVSLLLVIVMAFGMMTGCSKSDGYEIALITDKGNIDDKSFNQGSWEGVVEFAKKNKITHQYYKPEDGSDAGYLASIELAISGGAKVIVTPGYLFEVPIYEAQTKYPEIKFIFLDGAPRNTDYTDYTIMSNVASIMYAEEESGYLAGYAAVKDGYRKLGFMGGMSVPSVQAFGYGYLQGAEAAAKELGLASGDISVIYHYTGDFAETDTNKSTAKTIYQEGTEVIFACGGSVGKSVMAAAKEAGTKVIGVDTDQRYDSDTVITSAMKGLGASVVQVLESIYNTNNWDTYGGTTTYFEAKNDGVGLPTVVIGDKKADAFDRFNEFDKATYDAVFAKLVDGSVDPIRKITVADTDTDIATADELVNGLGLSIVTVEVR